MGSDNYDVQYRYQSMKVIRGREAKAIAKMENQGWDLHDQDQGKLRTEIRFRRVKKPTPWRLVTAGAVAAVIAIAVVGGIIAILGGSLSELDAPPSATETTEPSDEPTPSAADETTGDPTAEPTETETVAPPVPSEAAVPTPAVDEVLTVDNNPDLRMLLTRGQDDNLSQAFAQQYEGRTIGFDGNVSIVGPHEGYETRFDFLIYVGDYSETVANPGPPFQFRDVNFLDLNLQGRGSSVGTGDNLQILAEVREFEPRTSLFLLDPVSTRLR